MIQQPLIHWDMACEEFASQHLDTTTENENEVDCEACIKYLL